MKYNKIVLIGMMGSGKSSISKILAKKINFTSIELDKLFEEQENISINDFFKKYGEKDFREKEAKILIDSLQNKDIVLSTGGGIILKESNRKLLFKDNILTIFLEASSEIIYERIKNDSSRPLLQVPNPKKEIEEILKKREKYYNLAKIKINTDNKTIEEIIEEILKWIK
ncbi:MAG: shikimate kinase [Candidatus Gastranaerophilales bacterium]|nr:shikimate kinase [Candidatus Gastranaerophilales bacterium]